MSNVVIQIRVGFLGFFQIRTTVLLLTVLLNFGVLVREEVDGLAVSALRCAIAEVKQRWSVIGWVNKNFII
jgi:hypothetical protein